MIRPIPVAEVPRKPLPISVTLATTDQVIYSMTGPADLAHRFAKPSNVGVNDGLLDGLTTALRSITAQRKSDLTRGLNLYRTKMEEMGFDCSGTGSELQITIRTSSTSLVSVGPELGELIRGTATTGLLRDLAIQLERFEKLKWILLEDDAAELLALKRWSEAHCRPGLAAYRDSVDSRWHRGLEDDVAVGQVTEFPNRSDDYEVFELAA